MDTAIMLALNLFGVFMEMVTLWYLLKMILGQSPNKLSRIIIILILTGALSLLVALESTSANQRRIGCFLVYMLPALCLYDGSFLLKAFAVGLFIALADGAESLVKVLLVAINGDLAAFSIINSWGKYAQGLFMSKFLAFAIVRLLSFLRRVQQHGLSKGVILTYAILPIATILAISLLMKGSYIFDHQTTYIFTLITIGLLIASNIVLFYRFERQAEEEQNRLKYALLEKQQEEQARFYTQLAEEKAKANRLYHDWDKILLALSGYLQNNQVEKALAYIAEQTIALQGAVCHYTGDMAIDTVLSEKARLAQQQGAVLQIASFIQSPLQVSGMDMAILLANALDNALEATQAIPQAEIAVKLNVSAEYIDLMIKNPVDHAVKIKGNTIETTKADKKLHGIGLRSIEHIAEAYSGDIKLYEENGQFILDIMMMNEQKIFVRPKNKLFHVKQFVAYC